MFPYFVQFLLLAASYDTLLVNMLIEWYENSECDLLCSCFLYII